MANESSKTGTKKTKKTRIRTSTRIRTRRIKRTRRVRRIRNATLEMRTLRTNVVITVVRSMGTMVGMGIRLSIRLGIRGDIRAGIRLSNRLSTGLGVSSYYVFSLSSIPFFFFFLETRIVLPIVHEISLGD